MSNNPYRRNARSLGRLAISVSASALVIGLGSGVAHAQTTPPAEEQQAEPDIVVTGFRASVANAVNQKRNADIVVDIVSADDIAGLPDVSIAESLARLPGVTSQRTGGQSSAINIRGLSQDLVSATLNGREQVSTAGSRAIEFEQYPSELLQQAAVYKSPKASQIEGGVAGKVELTTVRPLSNKAPLTFTVNARGSWNDRANQSTDANEFGYRVSGSLQAQIIPDVLGVAIGYSRLVQPNVATRFVGYDYRDGLPNPIDVNGDGVREIPGAGFEGIQFGGTETRDGLLGVVEFHPTDSLRVLVDGYYSNFNSDVRRRGIRIQGLANIQAQDVSNAVVSNGAIIGGRVQSGNGGGLTATLVNQNESDDDRLYTIGGKIEKDFGSRAHLVLDASYSSADSFFNNSGINVDAFSPDDGNPATPRTRLQDTRGALVVNYRLNGLQFPNVAINHDFTNPANNLFQGFYIVPQRDEDQLLAFAGDFTLDFDNSFLKSLQFGGRYSERDARRTITSFTSFGIANPVQLSPNQYQLSGFTGDFARAGLPNFLVVNIDSVLDQYVGARVPDQTFGFTLDQSFTIREDVWSLYGQANFDTQLGNLPFRGNLGLRFVHTSQNSTASNGISTPDNPATPQREDRLFYTVGDSYNLWLPSANAVLELSPGNQIRFAASRQISRAQFFDLRATTSVGFAGSGVPNASGGNPFLRPFLSNQVDLGFEHYFGNDGIASVTGFYKNLETFIVGGATSGFDFAAAGLQPLLNAIPITPGAPGSPGSPPRQTVGNFDQPINGSGGYVWGFEFNFTYNLKFLPGALDGLGVIFNYAYTESDLGITDVTSGRTASLALPGLSRHVANPTVFYEKYGFGARVGVRYRSSFVAPQIGLRSNPLVNAPETVVDAQISYEFPKGSPLHGVKLLAQGENLFDTPNRTYWTDPEKTSTFQYFGRVVYVGATFKF